jgi:hypothetical protein
MRVRDGREREKNIAKPSRGGKASIYDERMQCKIQGYHTQATRLCGIRYLRENMSCPSSTMAIDQLGLRGEVALGDAVEVSADSRPVGELS